MSLKDKETERKMFIVDVCFNILHLFHFLAITGNTSSEVFKSTNRKQNTKCLILISHTLSFSLSFYNLCPIELFGDAIRKNMAEEVIEIKLQQPFVSLSFFTLSSVQKGIFSEREKRTACSNIRL